ncbi:hypothetical protein ACLKA7_010212 [Drosophila subpalustris]
MALKHNELLFIPASIVVDNDDENEDDDDDEDECEEHKDMENMKKLDREGALESLRRVAAATIKATNSVKLCAANKRIFICKLPQRRCWQRLVALLSTHTHIHLVWHAVAHDRKTTGFSTIFSLRRHCLVWPFLALFLCFVDDHVRTPSWRRLCAHNPFALLTLPRAQTRRS